MNETIVAAPPSPSERRWAAGVHLSALVLAALTSWAAGVAGMVSGAGVLLLRPMGSTFVIEHAKEAFNFNLSMFLYMVLGFLLSVVTLGLGLVVVVPLAVVLALMWLACTVIAAVQASDGLPYRYPLSLRFWR